MAKRWVSSSATWVLLVKRVDGQIVSTQCAPFALGTVLRLLLPAALAVLLLPEAQGYERVLLDSSRRASVILTLEDLRPGGGLQDDDGTSVGFGARTAYAVHADPEFRPFRLGESADETVHDFFSSTTDMRSQIAERLPGALFDYLTPFNAQHINHGNSVFNSPFEPVVQSASLRYLTYYIALCPSDDAFIANQLPIELFDENGHFKGPFAIDLYGDDVLDAGILENEESALECLDDYLEWTAARADRVFTDEPVQRHPGYNGSTTNPDAVPARILGAEGSYLDQNARAQRYSYPDAITDFTRYTRKAGKPFARLRVVSGVHGGFNGTYYDTRLDGEGITVEISGPWQSRHASMTWYTYRPDGSGEPIFLIGSGPVNSLGSGAEVELFEARGGRFASPENPGLVETFRWGSVSLNFNSCTDITVTNIAPEDPAYTVNNPIYLQRISATPSGLEKYCGGSVNVSAPAL